jgi:hypothetical protein
MKKGGIMSKVTHVVLEGDLYDVQEITADTLAEFVKDVPRYALDKVLKHPNYIHIKKVKDKVI